MYILDSKIPGPTIAILGGIHGNETCGVKAIDMIRTWNITKGTVLLEIGNPRAVEANTRFTETNLNRMFLEANDYTEEERTSYEYLRAQELKPLLDSADILLDIHASNTRESVPFIICENNGLEFAKLLPGAFCCTGFMNLHPGSTDYYMNKKEKIGLCIECGYTQDPSSTNTAVTAARILLSSLGMIRGDAIQCTEKTYLNAYDIYRTKTNSFTLTKEFEDFADIEKDTVIGMDGEQEVFSQKRQKILFARNRSQIQEDAFVLLQPL